MGVLYSVIPLVEVTKEKEGREWLDTFRVPYSLPKEGRYPSLKEVRDTIRATQYVSISNEHIGPEHWDLGLEGIGDESTSLRCIDYDGDELTPHPIYFEKGWSEVIVRTTAALSRLCGDFLIVADCGSNIIVTPETPCDAEWFGFDEDTIYDPTEDDAADELEIAASLEAESLHTHLAD